MEPSRFRPAELRIVRRVEKVRFDMEQRLQELHNKLADLKARWPAHSVKPELINQLEDIEEEISELQAKLNRRPLDEACHSKNL